AGLWHGGEARNCVIFGNASRSGGGVYLDEVSLVASCTVVGNSADEGGGILDTGRGSLVMNSIVWHNAAHVGANGYMPNGLGNWSYTCVYPMIRGWGNIVDAPKFADPAGLNFRLQLTSPCLNAGTNQAWMAEGVDLAGQARISEHVVDMGAYELAVHYLAVESNGGGTVQPDSGYQLAGERVLLTATPADGYAFRGWSGDVPDGAIDRNPLLLEMNGPRRIIANFRQVSVGMEAEAPEAETAGALITEAVADNDPQAAFQAEAPAVIGLPEAPAGAEIVTDLYPPSATYSDADGDGMQDADERLAGTDPLNAEDVLRIGSLESLTTYDSALVTEPARGHVLVWESKNGVRYGVEYATNLSDGFFLLESNILGVAPLQTYVDPNEGGEQRFYRIRLE
ncbi:MAG: hypothetical protein O3B24_11775, partial [Verrucomicrobia bacterium]|nr:hypothetical protein [Verrucomicrobiota bacterium]